MEQPLHQQSLQVLQQCITTAEQYFGRSFRCPSLNFKVRGKTAGKAYLQANEVRLNQVLFDENPQEFLTDVIPHEVAHLITHQIFGKVKPHGKEWQMIMEQVFHLPAKTTHRFSIASVQGPTFRYLCGCTTHQLTIRRHNKVQRQQSQYRCQQCHKFLVWQPE